MESSTNQMSTGQRPVSKCEFDRKIVEAIFAALGIGEEKFVRIFDAVTSLPMSAAGVVAASDRELVEAMGLKTSLSTSKTLLRRYRKQMLDWQVFPIFQVEIGSRPDRGSTALNVTRYDLSRFQELYLSVTMGQLDLDQEEWDHLGEIVEHHLKRVAGLHGWNQKVILRRRSKRGRKPDVLGHLKTCARKVAKILYHVPEDQAAEVALTYAASFRGILEEVLRDRAVHGPSPVNPETTTPEDGPLTVQEPSENADLEVSSWVTQSAKTD